jgi:predicted GNAT family N-acyltransferase
MLKVKQISPEDTYEIRYKVLRPNQTIADCQYEKDHEVDTFHIGGYLDENLISIASFYKEKNPCFNDELQYRLRGMATLPENRKQKSGTSLLYYAEDILKEKKVTLWWCNARSNVSGYYKKLGLSEYGEEFDIVPIGLHKLMVKKIAPSN